MRRNEKADLEGGELVAGRGRLRWSNETMSIRRAGEKLVHTMAELNFASSASAASRMVWTDLRSAAETLARSEPKGSTKTAFASAALEARKKREEVVVSDTRATSGGERRGRPHALPPVPPLIWKAV